MGYCLHSLAKMQDKASASDKKIIQYIIDNPVTISGLSIEMLSNKTGTSYATVVRFCKKMGFDGFKDLKKHLMEELQEDYCTYANEYVEHSKTFQQIKREINDLYMKIHRDCQANITAEVFESAAEAIIKAPEIYFIGQGTSSVSARYAYLKFLQLNLTCANDSDVTIIKTKTAFLKKNSVLFAISSSGRTKPIIEAAMTAQQAGAIVISVTDFYTSPLSNIAEIRLCTTFRDYNQYVKEDFPLVVGQMELIDVLQSVCASKMSNVNDLFKTIKEQAQTEKIQQ